MSELQAQTTETIPAAFVYRWMAGLYFAPPDTAGLAAYRAPEGQVLLARFAEVPALAPLVAEIAALTGPGRDLDAEARRLTAAHAAAFLVGGRHGAAPYASVWLSARGLMYQEPARAMTRLLAAADLKVSEDIPEPPDHIGYQLNLLAELVERQQAGGQIPISPETFIRDHMEPWLPDFAAAAKRLRDPVLYAPLAAATLDYLSEKK